MELVNLKLSRELIDRIEACKYIEIIGRGVSANEIDLSPKFGVLQFYLNPTDPRGESVCVILTKAGAFEHPACLVVDLAKVRDAELRGASSSILVLLFCELIYRQVGKKIALIGFDFQPSYFHDAYSSDNQIVPCLATLKKLKGDFEGKFLEISQGNFVHIGNSDVSLLPANVYALVRDETTLLDIFAGGATYDSCYEFQAHLDLADFFKRGNSLLTVAEITTNHYGCTARLLLMIKLSAEQGAKAIKLQKRCITKIYSEEDLTQYYSSPFGSTFENYRVALELSDADFQAVDALCHELGITWFCSVLDLESLQKLQGMGAVCVKVPSTVSENVDLLEYIRTEYSGQLVISTGFTGSEYEDWVLNSFSHLERLAILHCVSSYPAPKRFLNLNVLKKYVQCSKESNGKILAGYSSHDDGSQGCALAVALGAVVLEKHVKVGGTAWGHFDHVALDLMKNEFFDYANDVAEAQLMLGDGLKRVQPCEHHKYRFRKAKVWD